MDGQEMDARECKYITLENNDNKYVKPPSIHEKYAARPDSLEHICLAQFAMWYESTRSNAKEPKNLDALSMYEWISYL